MSETTPPQTPSPSPPPFASRVISDVLLKRMFGFGCSFLTAGLLCAVIGAVLVSHTNAISSHHQEQIEQVQTQINHELDQLNHVPPEFPEPQALQNLLQLGKSINTQSQGFVWFGQLFAQKEQYLTTRAIEALSQPIGGVNLSQEQRASAETNIRLRAQNRLRELSHLIDEASNGYATLAFVLAVLMTLGGGITLINWLIKTRTNSLAKRVNALGRALHSQQENDLLRMGASKALDGVRALLEKTRNLEQRQTLMELGEHLQHLKQSGHSVLQFAHAFHHLSTQATHVAKTALTSEQRNNKADAHLDVMRQQLDGLREDVRNAAQGLRKAGEASRQLLANLDPHQLQLALNEPEKNDHLQKLVEQSQQALKEAIEGLVLASQKINTSRQENSKLAEYMALNQSSWSTLLEEVEQYAGSASTESAKALLLAKKLIQDSRALEPAALEKPSATQTTQTSIHFEQSKT